MERRLSRRPGGSGDVRHAIRRHRLSLTPQGEEIVRSRHADRLARLSRLVDRLSDEERSVLAGSARVLARLTEIAAVIGD
jgi:DNA-binding MarR family transcriptional regulator